MNIAQFNFESLTVYQRSLALSKQIYQLTQTWPKEHLFGITDQLRQAIVSIVLNIAEGSSETKKDFCHLLIIARGSVFECIPIIELAHSLKLITDDKKLMYMKEMKEIALMLSGLRIKLNSS
ncbi:four helix bundle protein [Candidatus Gottesmanbacteria bacterium]|nr:four helix bundle protein [Candidatus Gottesmanbacteria bacterium]